MGDRIPDFLRYNKNVLIQQIHRTKTTVFTGKKAGVENEIL